MNDLKEAIENKLNNPPEVFNIENYPKEEYATKAGEIKQRYVVPDDIFEEHMKELPEATVNESHSRRKAATGCINIFGANPEKDREIQRQGAETLNAAKAQRRTWREQAQEIMAAIDKKTGKSGLESMMEAQYERAITGDTKAAQFIRDTAGEKPAEAVDLNANIMTEADKALMEKLKSRLE